MGEPDLGERDVERVRTPAVQDRGRTPIVALARWFTLLLIASLIPVAFGDLVAPHKDFYNELWVPASLVVRGQSAYDTAALQTPLPAVWMPMAVGAFAPLGWLSEPVATMAWFLFTVAAVAAIVHLTLPRTAPLHLVAAAALLAYFFPPTLNHFLLGQFSLQAVLFLLLAAKLLEGGREWPAAFMLALGSSKPNLALLPVLGLGLHCLQHFGLKATARFAAKALAACLVLGLPVALASPEWLGDYLEGWQRNPPWMHPSAFVLLRQWLGNWGILVWGVLALAVLAACFKACRRLPASLGLYWMLALTALLSPYIWSWDFVLLLPLWTWTLSRVDRRRQAVLLAAYLAGWAGMAAVQLFGQGGNLLYWWVPWWFIGAIWFCSLPGTAVSSAASYATPPAL